MKAGQRCETLELALHEVRLASEEIVTLQNSDEDVRIRWVRTISYPEGVFLWWSEEHGHWVASTRHDVLANNRHWPGPYRVVLHA